VLSGDVLCLIEGAAHPAIIRLRGDYALVITSAIILSEDLPEEFSTQDLSRTTERQPVHGVYLVWDWEGPRSSQKYSEAQKDPGSIDFLHTHLPGSSAVDLPSISEDFDERRFHVQLMRREVQE